jgi:hypothetical protein
VGSAAIYSHTTAHICQWGVDCFNTVLYGSVAEWILQYRKGWRKFDNFKKLREQNDGRTKYVLVGDTGEYDQQVCVCVCVRARMCVCMLASDIAKYDQRLYVCACMCTCVRACVRARIYLCAYACVRGYEPVCFTQVGGSGKFDQYVRTCVCGWVGVDGLIS